MRNKNFYVCLLLFFMLSCSKNNQSIKNATIVIQNDTIVASDTLSKDIHVSNQNDTIVTSDTLSKDIHVSNQNDTQYVEKALEEDIFGVPPYYDFYSEVIIYYERYIGKAYNKEIHQKYFETKERYKLDSLIKMFERNQCIQKDTIVASDTLSKDIQVSNQNDTQYVEKVLEEDKFETQPYYDNNAEPAAGQIE